MSHHSSKARGGIFAKFLYLGRLGKESSVIDRRAGSLANLAQNEKHILLAGQSSQQCAFRQRLELLWGDAESADEVAVVANFVEDRAFLARREVQLVV